MKSPVHTANAPSQWIVLRCAPIHTPPAVGTNHGPRGPSAVGPLELQKKLANSSFLGQRPRIGGERGAAYICRFFVFDASFAVSATGGGIISGHGSGQPSPRGRRPWCSNPARICVHPRWKMAIRRQRGRRLCCVCGTSSIVSSGNAASASPPTDNNHHVATATASHSRSARAGSSMRVYCHCQPPLLIRLNPCSIQARKPYQQTSPASGGKSVRTNQGSAYPSPQQARRVQSNCADAVLKAVPRPCQR